jgi:hypothetical protein
MAVGVAGVQYVLVPRERIEPGLVVEVLQAEIVIATPAPRCEARKRFSDMV